MNKINLTSRYRFHQRIQEWWQPWFSEHGFREETCCIFAIFYLHLWIFRNQTKGWILERRDDISNIFNQICHKIFHIFFPVLCHLLLILAHNRSIYVNQKHVHKISYCFLYLGHHLYARICSKACLPLISLFRFISFPR